MREELIKYNELQKADSSDVDNEDEDPEKVLKLRLRR